MMNPAIQEHVIRLGRMTCKHTAICGMCRRKVVVQRNQEGDCLVRHSGPRCVVGGRRFAEEMFFSPVEDVDLWPGDRVRIVFENSRRSKIFVFKGLRREDISVAVSGPFGGG